MHLLFNRNYGDYKLGKAYEKSKVNIEKDELEKLMKNGTVEVMEDEDFAGTTVKEFNVTMTFIKNSHKDVYDQIFKKGQESKAKEIEDLNTQVKELTAKVAELEAK